MSRKFNLEYHYPHHTGAAAYPSASQSICAAIGKGLFFHRMSSVVLILSIFGLTSFWISHTAGLLASCVLVAAVVFKIVVLMTLGVQFEYRMDANWRNYANTRMAPFTYMSQSKCLWEVIGSTGGFDRKYNAGCSVHVQRKNVRVAYSVPFPFKPNVKAYTLYLPDVKFVFLPDCVYMVKEASCTAVRYELIKWASSMTTFVESRAPEDSQVVGRTWQYVNKKGGPDRRFSHNPMFVECSYGELSVNFSCYRHVKLLLSGTKASECIMRLNATR